MPISPPICGALGIVREEARQEQRAQPLLTMSHLRLVLRLRVATSLQITVPRLSLSPFPERIREACEYVYVKQAVQGN
jgi:hypothetical protein